MKINVSEADVTSNESPIKRKPDVAYKQNYFAYRVMSPPSSK
jgi:hypothetical protein